MVPLPVVVGLTVCDYVLVDQRTKKPTLVGLFGGITATSFPANPAPFYVFTALIDGQGEGCLQLTITELESDEEVYQLERTIRFPDRFTEIQVDFRIGSCIFPRPGMYQITLFLDGEWIAHRRLRLSKKENLP